VAWTKLWLRQTAEVEAMISKIPADRQEELWEDLYRLVRSEKPAELAELTARMPSHLLLPLRIESARLIGSSESPEGLLQELKTAAEKETTWSAWLQYARAAWKLAQAEEIWRPALQTSLDLAKKLSGADQCLALGEIGGLMMDTGEFASGRTALQQAQVAAGQEADPARKLHGLAQLHQLAFRSSEPEEARKILTELDALRTKAPLSPPDAQILVTALFKSGSWAEAISLAQSLPDQDLVSPLAHLVLESTAAHGFELSQDKSYAKLRQVAISQGEAAAAAMNMREDPGLNRGRGWLEMAKAGAVRTASP
jgi:tetratricopeptide (TPR) repeat protein